MLRNLGVGRLRRSDVAGGVQAFRIVVARQDAGSLDPGIAPEHGALRRGTTQNDGRVQRIDRDSLTRPDLRAAAVDPNTGKPVDPRVEALLEEWSERTKQIKRLQGRHFRATRNFEWGNESWAEGQFYVETPDKGRIDMRPYSKDFPIQKR